MSEYITYKTKGRYALGWADPRVILGGDTGHIDIGAYRLAELYHVSDEAFDIFHRTSATPREIARVNKKEFAACIEAFLQEKKDEHAEVQST